MAMESLEALVIRSLPNGASESSRLDVHNSLLKSSSCILSMTPIHE